MKTKKIRGKHCEHITLPPETNDGITLNIDMDKIILSDFNPDDLVEIDVDELMNFDIDLDE